MNVVRFLKLFSVYFLLLFIPQLIRADIIYIAPFIGSDPKQVFYNENSLNDGSAKPFCRLREALEKSGHQVKFIKGMKKLDKQSVVISFNNVTHDLLSSLLKVTKSKKRFLFVFEPPVVSENFYQKSMYKYFDKIFVMMDDYVDGKRYFKFNYPQPQLKPIDKTIPFDEKKFCALIARNKRASHKSELYSERVKTIKFFEQLPMSQLDLFGLDWKGFKSWKGTVDSKWDTLYKYKFCICYENMHNQNGYITEKIFDCLVAQCVPIYWGASNIESYVPGDCFIDRRLFSSNQELYDFLEGMDEETHEKYLSSARAFLESSTSKIFSIDSFVELVLKNLAL